MAAVRKARSHRKVAAFNFLSNISLDGSHNDTKYGLLKKQGIQGRKVSADSRPKCGTDDHQTNGLDANEIENPETFCSKPFATQEASNDIFKENKYKENFESKLTPVKDEQSEVLTEIPAPASVSEETKTAGESPSKRHRANSFSGDEKRPSSRRRRLFTSLSISEDTPPPDVPCVGSLSDHNPLSVSGSRSRHRSTSSSSSLTSSSRTTLHVAHKDSSCLKPTIRHKTKHNRVVLVTKRKAPFVLFSDLPYNKWSQQGHTRNEMKQKLTEGSSEVLVGLGLHDKKIEDGQDISYSQFLVPTTYSTSRKTSRYSQGVPSEVYLNDCFTSPVRPSTEAPPLLKRSFSHDTGLLQRYHGNQLTPLPTVVETAERDVGLDNYCHDLLDDPELRSGKHRTLLTFTSYMTSVIDYAKPSDLKKELNEKFRLKFPYIQLSLSKLRSLKNDMRKVAHTKLGLDLWVVAQAYVYFEKVILKGFITKPVRRLCAAVCLILSAKMNDVKGPELTRLIDEVEDFFKLNRRELLATEFGVLIALEFSLLVPDSEVKPHHQRLAVS